MEQTMGVSIICNTYNHEKYIRDALDGFIMQQTDFPFEILIHDDASTDKTQDIIREYEQKYPALVKPIYQVENQYSKHDGTISRIQNERAKGKYIACCEGDDYWTDPRKLQKQYDFMETHPDYSMCGCSTQWVNVLTGKTQNRGTVEQDRDFSLEDFLMPENGRPFLFVSFFIRAEVWKERPLWGFPMGDLPMTYYAAMQGKVHMLADNMCVYRWFSDGSWTARMYNDQDRIKINKKMLKGFEAMNRDTEYRYDELIQRKIRSVKYSLAIYEHDYKAIKSEELIDIYRNKSMAYRLKDYMHCRMPKLFNFVMKIISNTR